MVGLLSEIEIFLLKYSHSAAKNCMKFIKDNHNVVTIAAFLADIFQHKCFQFETLRYLAIRLICLLVPVVNYFCKKMELFSQEYGNQKFHFPNLKKVFGRKMSRYYEKYENLKVITVNIKV